MVRVLNAAAVTLVVLVACAQTSVEPAPGPNTRTTLTGQIQGYAGPVTTLNLMGPNDNIPPMPHVTPASYDPTRPFFETYASGAVDAQGRFSLALPSSAKVYATLADAVANVFPQGLQDPVTGAYTDCQSSIVVSDGSVGVARPVLTVADGTRVWEGPHPFDPARFGRHFTTIDYWYASAPASVTGHCGRETINIHLVPGWNAVTFDDDHDQKRVQTTPDQQFSFFLDSATPPDPSPAPTPAPVSSP